MHGFGDMIRVGILLVGGLGILYKEKVLRQSKEGTFAKDGGIGAWPELVSTNFDFDHVGLNLYGEKKKKSGFLM